MQGLSDSISDDSDDTKLANIEEHLENRGITVTPQQADAIVQKVKQISIEKKALLSDEEFDAVVKAVQEQAAVAVQ